MPDIRDTLRRLVQADAVRGRDVTSYPSIRRDLENAGARWIDAEVAADGGIITSRSPKDLPAFIAAVIERLQAPSQGRRPPDIPDSAGTAPPMGGLSRGTPTPSGSAHPPPETKRGRTDD